MESLILLLGIIVSGNVESEEHMETEELLSWQEFRAWEGFQQQVSIHSPKSIKFYEDVLKADQWVLNVLRNKLLLPLPEFVPEYWEPNNQSALKEMPFLWSKFIEWENQGFVLRVKERPHCVNPLTVGRQNILQSGTVKLRPCLDVSRLLNKLMPDEKVKLSDLTEAEKLVDKNDYLMSLDLENQYFHVQIQEKQWKYLGCQVQNPETEEKHFFLFKVMIYGLKNAVRVVTRLTKPIVAKLHQENCKFSIYIDDGRTVGKTAEETMKNNQKAINLFHSAGWNIQWKKTEGTPLQSQYHMGFITCTTQMIYCLPDFKINHLKNLIQEVISFHTEGKKIEARMFAKLLGSLVSGQRALGPLIRVSLRSGHVLLDRSVTEAQSWQTSFHLSQRVIQDLRFIFDIMQAENGQPIIKGRTGETCNKLFPGAGHMIPTSERPIRTQFSTEILGGKVTSDSSDWKKFAYSKDFKIVFSEEMTLTEQQLSSSHRELLSASGAVQNNKEYFRGETSAHKLFYWLTDSQNLETWSRKGSLISEVQQELMILFRLQSELNMRIIFVWAPRDHPSIALADEGSKFLDTDDWSICNTSYGAIQIINGSRFTCDVFASSSTNKVSKFYSKVPSVGSSGINAFAQDWRFDVNFVCPPVKLIPAVIHHLSMQQCQGVLVIPEWRTAIFWPLITTDGVHYIETIQKIHRFAPDFHCQYLSSHSVFRTGNKVNMVALFFNSGIVQQSKFMRCSQEGCNICKC